MSGLLGIDTDHSVSLAYLMAVQ